MNFESLKALVARFRRHLFSVISTVVAVGALLTSGLWWMGIQNLLDEHELKEKANKVILNMWITGPVLKTELAAVREFTKRLEANLTDSDALSDNDDYFRRIAGRAGAIFVDLQQSSSPAMEEGALFKRVPFNVRVAGSYQQTQAFLYAVETGPRLANITSLNMLRMTPNSTDVSLEIGLELIGKK